MFHEASDPVGVAVLIPGFLDSKDYVSFVSLARALPTIGITAVRFDPRGTWESDGSPADCTTTQQIHDVSTILDELPRSSSGRQILVGFCYGAYVAALTAVSLEQITEVVAIMPTRLFIWTEDYDESKDTWRCDGERRYVRDLPELAGSVTVHVPYSVVEDAKEYRFIDPWKSLRQPILFMAGEGDGIITPDRVRALYQSCGSQRKDLTVLPDVLHDYRYDDKQIEKVNQATLRWLQKHP